MDRRRRFEWEQRGGDLRELPRYQDGVKRCFLPALIFSMYVLVASDFQVAPSS
jgi:hypothetical protein